MRFSIRDALLLTFFVAIAGLYKMSQDNYAFAEQRLEAKCTWRQAA